jgi:hypothetical protein
MVVGEGVLSVCNQVFPASVLNGGEDRNEFLGGGIIDDNIYIVNI